MGGEVGFLSRAGTEPLVPEIKPRPPAFIDQVSSFS